MTPLLLAILVLQPIVDEPTEVRMVATGVDDAEVEWYLDGAHLGTTKDRQPLHTQLPVGQHNLSAHADAADWLIMARPDEATEGIRAVDAWTASMSGGQYHAEARPAALRMPTVMVGLFFLAALAVGLARKRRPDPHDAIPDLLGALGAMDGVPSQGETEPIQAWLRQQ